LKSLAAGLEQATGAYVLRGARVPAALLPAALAGLADAQGLAGVDLAVEGGRLRRVAPAGTLQGSAGPDLAGRQVWPAFHP